MVAQRNYNYTVLKFFAPILILTGILGFVLPKEASLISNASYYNIFHIISGLIGLLFVFSKNNNLIKGFNLVFGIVDIYQAIANWFKLFPLEYFQWTVIDDIVHLIIGIALIFIACIPNHSKNTIE